MIPGGVIPGGGIPGVTTGTFTGGPIALGGTGAATGAAPAAGGRGSLAQFAGFLPGLKGLLGIGGSVQLGSGAATTWEAATLGQKMSAIGHSNAALLGGATLAMMGLQRGGLSGLAMTTAGGALMGFKFGGPVGAAIGAGIGAVAGTIRLFVKGAEEKAREKIKALYGVDISDKGILRQIVDTAKQAFGGNLDVAIRSPQVRELIELYGMSTGQRPSGMPEGVRAVTLTQLGGSLYQQPSYSNGSPAPSFGGLPVLSLDRIGTGTPQNAGPIVLNFTMPAEAVKDAFDGRTVQVIVDNPRAVQSASLAATKSSFARREAAASLLGPGTVFA